MAEAYGLPCTLVQRRMRASMLAFGAVARVIRSTNPSVACEKVRSFEMICGEELLWAQVLCRHEEKSACRAGAEAHLIG